MSVDTFVARPSGVRDRPIQWGFEYRGRDRDNETEGVLSDQSVEDVQKVVDILNEAIRLWGGR